MGCARARAGRRWGGGPALALVFACACACVCLGAEGADGGAHEPEVPGDGRTHLLRELASQRKMMVRGAVRRVQQGSGTTTWVSPVPLPAEDLAVVAWMWELIDVATGEVVAFQDISALHEHHSAVHPQRGPLPRYGPGPMANSFHLLGSVNHYNKVLSLPEPYAVVHRADDDPWYMCSHVPQNALGGADVVVVQQRLTLWVHEFDAARDRRVLFHKFGLADDFDHPFGHDGIFERRAMIGKMPPFAGEFVGVVYHIHEGVLHTEVEDPVRPAMVDSFPVPPSLPIINRVVDVPFIMFSEPYRWEPGQFLYLNTLVNMSAVRGEDKLRGPMINTFLMAVYDDQEHYFLQSFGLNPEQYPCNRRVQGLQGTECKQVTFGELLDPRYPAVSRLPQPFIRGCLTASEDSCVHVIDHPGARPEV